METMSQDITELTKALVKAQGQIMIARESAKNPYFKSEYSTLKDIWDACREPLTANGLAVVQTLDGGEGEVVVITTMMHESGQWIRGRIPFKPAKIDSQALGSLVTYLKRYSLSAITGVVSSFEDDDGEGSMDRDKKETQESPSKNGNGSEAKKPYVISEAQRKRFYAISQEHKWADGDVKTLLHQYGYESSKDIEKEAYKELCDKLEAGVTAETDGVPF